MVIIQFPFTSCSSKIDVFKKEPIIYTIMARGKLGLVIVISIVLIISLSVAVYSQQFTTFPLSSPSTGQLKCGDSCKNQPNDCPGACPCGIHPDDVNLISNLARYICGGDPREPQPLSSFSIISIPNTLGSIFTKGPESAIFNFSAAVFRHYPDPQITYDDYSKQTLFQELRTKTKQEIDADIRSMFAYSNRFRPWINVTIPNDIDLFGKLLGAGNPTFERELERELIGYLDRRKIVVPYPDDKLGEQVDPYSLYYMVENPDLKNKIVEYISTYSQARGTTTLEQETGRTWKIMNTGMIFNLFNSNEQVTLHYPKDPTPELDTLFDRLLFFALLSKEPFEFNSPFNAFRDADHISPWFNKWIDKARKSSIVDNINKAIIKHSIKTITPLNAEVGDLKRLIGDLTSKNLHTDVSYKIVKNSLDENPSLQNLYLIFYLYPDYFSVYFEEKESKDIINNIFNPSLFSSRSNFDALKKFIKEAPDFFNKLVYLILTKLENLAIQHSRVDEEIAQQINTVNDFLNSVNIESAQLITQKVLESIKKMSVATPLKPYTSLKNIIINGGYSKITPGTSLFRSELNKLESTLNYLNDEQGYYIRLDSAPRAGTDFWTPNKKKLSYNLWKADLYSRISYHFYNRVKPQLENIEIRQYGYKIESFAGLKTLIDKLYQKSSQEYKLILQKYRPLLPGIPGIGTGFWTGPTFLDDIKSYISSFIPESLRDLSDDPDPLVSNYLNSIYSDIIGLVPEMRKELTIAETGSIKITGLKDVAENLFETVFISTIIVGNQPIDSIIQPLLNELSSSNVADTEYRGHLIDLIQRILNNKRVINSDELKGNIVNKLIAYVKNKNNPERAAIAVILEHSKSKLIIPAFRRILCDPDEKDTNVLQTAVRALRRLDAYDDATQNCLRKLKTDAEQKIRTGQSSPSFQSFNTYVGDTISFVETGEETSLLNPDLQNAPKQSSLYDSQGYQQYKDALKLIEEADSKKQAGQLPEALNFYALARNTLKELVASKPFGIAGQDPVSTETIKEKFVLVNSKIAEILSLIQDTTKILEEVDLLFDSAELSFQGGDFDNALKIYNDIKGLAETKLNVPRESNTILSDAYIGIGLIRLAEAEKLEKSGGSAAGLSSMLGITKSDSDRAFRQKESAMEMFGDALKFNSKNDAARAALRETQFKILAVMNEALGTKVKGYVKDIQNIAKGHEYGDEDWFSIIAGFAPLENLKYYGYSAEPVVTNLVNQIKEKLKATQMGLLFAMEMMKNHGLIFNDIIDLNENGIYIKSENLDQLKNVVKKYPGVDPESVESVWSTIYGGFINLIGNPDIERLIVRSKGTGYVEKIAKTKSPDYSRKGFEFLKQKSKYYDQEFNFYPGDEDWGPYLLYGFQRLLNVENLGSLVLGELKAGRYLLAIARGASKLPFLSKSLAFAAKLGITDATVIGELFKILPAKALSWSPLGGKRLLDLTPFHKWIFGNLVTSVGATTLGFYLDPTEYNRFARIGLMFYGGKSIADLTDFFSSSERIIAEKIAAGAAKGGPLAQKALEERLGSKLIARQTEIKSVEDIKKLAKEAAEEVGIPIIPRLRSFLPGDSGLQVRINVLSGGDLNVGDGVIRQEVIIGKQGAWTTTNPHVSRQHAKLFRTQDGGLGIQDLQSTNGVYVNGRKLSSREEVVLKNGDEVSLASPEKGVKFRIEIVSGTATLPGSNVIPDDVANRLVTKLKQERVGLGSDPRETLDALVEMEGRNIQLGSDEAFVYHVSDLKYSSSISRRGLISGYSGGGRVGGQATDDVAEQYLPDRFKGKGFTRGDSVFAHPTVLDSGLDGEVKYIERRGGAIKYKSKVKKGDVIVVDSADIAEYFTSMASDSAIQRYWGKAISIDEFNRYYKPTVPNKWGNGGMVFEKVPGSPTHLPDKFEAAEALVKVDIDPSHVAVETYGDTMLRVLQSENTAKLSTLATQARPTVVSVISDQVGTRLIGRLQSVADLGAEPIRFLNGLVDLERRVLTGGDAEFVYINKEFAEVKGVLRSKTIGSDQVFTGSEDIAEREAAELADQFLPERLKGVGHNRANSVIANPSTWDTALGYHLRNRGVKIKVKVNTDRSLVVDGNLHSSYIVRDFDREKYIKPYFESAVTLREFKTYYRLKSLGKIGTLENTIFERVPESQIPIELRGKLPLTIENPEVIIQENIPVSSATVHEYGSEIHSVLQTENARRFSDLVSTPAPLPPTSDIGGGAVSVGEVVDNVDDAVETALRDIQKEQSKKVFENLIKLSREGPQGIPTEQLQKQLPVRLPEYIPTFSVGRVEATEGFRLIQDPKLRIALLEAQDRLLQNAQELGHTRVLAERISRGEVDPSITATEVWQKAGDLQAKIQFDLNYIKSELKDAHDIVYKYDPKADRTVLSYKPKQARKFYLSSDIPNQAQAVRLVFNNNFRPIKTRLTVGGVEKDVTIYFPHEEIGLGKMIEMQNNLRIEVPGLVGVRPVKGVPDTYIVATHAIFPEKDFILRFDSRLEQEYGTTLLSDLAELVGKLPNEFPLFAFRKQLELLVTLVNPNAIGKTLYDELTIVFDDISRLIDANDKNRFASLKSLGGDKYSSYANIMDVIQRLKTHDLPLNLIKPAVLLDSLDDQFLMARFRLTDDELQNILSNPDLPAARHIYDEIVQTEWQALATQGSNIQASRFELSTEISLIQDGLIPVSIHTHPQLSPTDIGALIPSHGDYSAYRANSKGLMLSAEGAETDYLFNMIVTGQIPNKYTVINVLSDRKPTTIADLLDIDRDIRSNYVFGIEYSNGIPSAHLEFPGGQPSAINSVNDISSKPLAGPSIRLPGNMLGKEAGKAGPELNGALGRSSSRFLGIIGALGIATSIVAGPEIANAASEEPEIPLSEKVPVYSSLLDSDVPEDVINMALDQAALFVNAELVDKMAKIFFDTGNSYSSEIESKAGQKLLEISGNPVSSRFTQQAQIFNQDILHLAEEGKEIDSEKLKKLNIVRKFLELKGEEVKLLDKLPLEEVCDSSVQAGEYKQEGDRRSVAVGATSGTFKLKYNMFKLPDKIEVFYEGRSIFPSGNAVSCDNKFDQTGLQMGALGTAVGCKIQGSDQCDKCVGGTDGSTAYDVSFGPGKSTAVEVVVTTPDKDTRWIYSLSCPQGVTKPPKLSNFYILSSDIYSVGLRKIALKTILESGEVVGGTDASSDTYIKNNTVFFKNILKFGNEKQIKDFVKTKSNNILTYFTSVISKLQSKISVGVYQTIYENSHIIDLLGILISENSVARTRAGNIVKKLLSTGRGVYSDSKLIDLVIESFALETVEAEKVIVIDSIPITLLSHEKLFLLIVDIAKDKRGYYRDQLLLKDVAINILTASGDPRAIEIIKDLSKKDEIKFAQSGTPLNIVPVSIPSTIDVNKQLDLRLFIPEANKNPSKVDTVDSIVKSDTSISNVTMVETGPNTGVFVFGTPVHVVDSRCSAGGAGCPQTGVKVISTNGEDVKIYVGGSDVSVGVGNPDEIESPFIDPKLKPVVEAFESSFASTLGSVKDKRIVVYIQDSPVPSVIKTLSFSKGEFPNNAKWESLKKEIDLGSSGFVSTIDYSLTSVGKCLVSLSWGLVGLKITSCQDEYAHIEAKLYKGGQVIDSKTTGRLGHDKHVVDAGSFTFNKFADKVEVVFSKEDDADDYENLGLSITANTYSHAINTKGREIFSLATEALPPGQPTVETYEMSFASGSPTQELKLDTSSNIRRIFFECIGSFVSQPTTSTRKYKVDVFNKGNIVKTLDLTVTECREYESTRGPSLPRDTEYYGSELDIKQVADKIVITSSYYTFSYYNASTKAKIYYEKPPVQKAKITTALFGEIPNPTTKIIILKNFLDDIKRLPPSQIQNAILNAIATKVITILDENNQDAFKNQDILNLFGDVYSQANIWDIEFGETKRVNSFQGSSGTLYAASYQNQIIRFVVTEYGIRPGVGIIINSIGVPTGSCITGPVDFSNYYASSQGRGTDPVQSGKSSIVDCASLDRNKVTFSGILLCPTEQNPLEPCGPQKENLKIVELNNTDWKKTIFFEANTPEYGNNAVIVKKIVLGCGQNILVPDQKFYIGGQEFFSSAYQNFGEFNLTGCQETTINLNKQAYQISIKALKEGGAKAKIYYITQPRTTTYLFSNEVISNMDLSTSGIQEKVIFYDYSLGIRPVLGTHEITFTSNGENLTGQTVLKFELLDKNSIAATLSLDSSGSITIGDRASKITYPNIQKFNYRPNTRYKIIFTDFGSSPIIINGLSYSLSGEKLRFNGMYDTIKLSVSGSEPFTTKIISYKQQNVIIAVADTSGSDPFNAGVTVADQTIKESVETLYFSRNESQGFKKDKKVAVSKIVFGCGSKGSSEGNPEFSAYLVNKTEKTQAIFDENRAVVSNCEENPFEIKGEPIDSVEINSLTDSGGRAKIYYKETRQPIEINITPSPVQTVPIDVELRKVNLVDTVLVQGNQLPKFNIEVCVHGSQTLGYLLASRGSLPINFDIIDQDNNSISGSAGIGGNVLYLNNGKCESFTNILSRNFSVYNLTKCLDVILDKRNIVNETDETNNKLSCYDGVCSRSVPYVSPTKSPIQTTTPAVYEYKIKDVINLTSSLNNPELWYPYTIYSDYTIGTLRTENKFYDNNQYNPATPQQLYIGPQIGQSVRQQELYITTDSGKLIIYIPQAVNKGQFLNFYVANDGSTYYRDSKHDGTGTILTPEQAFVTQHLARAVPKAIQTVEPTSAQLLVDNLYSTMLNYWSFDKPYRCANDKLEDMGYRVEYEFISGGPAYRMPVLYKPDNQSCAQVGSPSINAISTSENTIKVSRMASSIYSLFDFYGNKLTSNINEDSLLAYSRPQNVPERWDIAIYANSAREDITLRINRNQGTEAVEFTKSFVDLTYADCNQALSNPNNFIAVTSRGKIDKPLCVKTREGSIFKIIEDRKTSGDVYFKWMQLTDSTKIASVAEQSNYTCPTIPIQPFAQPTQKIPTGCEQPTNNTRSFGSFEKVGIENQTGIQYLQGWAYDVDEPEKPVEISMQFRKGAEGFSKTISANQPRSDLVSGYFLPNTSINHGFKAPLTDIEDGVYTITMLATDPQTNQRKEIRRSPQEILINVSRTDLRLIGANVVDGDLLTVQACVYGHKTIEDLKINKPGLNGFPWKYEVLDSSGNKHEYAEQTQRGTTTKNGGCFYIDIRLKPDHKPIYSTTKAINVIIDPSDLIQEIDETNNKLTCVSGSCGTLKTQPTQSSVPAPITPSTCSGDISLTLSKTQVARQEVLTATASGLSGCDGRTVYIWQESTRPSQGWISCPVSGTGCSVPIIAPYVNKTYVSKASIDKNLDGDYSDSGEITGNLQYTVLATVPSPTTSPTPTATTTPSPSTSPTPTTTSLPKGSIVTIAGVYIQSCDRQKDPWCGDGGLATSAKLNWPSSIASDSSGNIYIADTVNHMIRKVQKSSGIISTIAGNGAGYSGDGGLATSAQFNNLYSIAVDSSDNIYIADTSNHRIRKIDKATGIIITVAGTGISGYSGDGGSATSAKLNTPFGIALDSSGNIYIADTYNNRIRKINKATGIIDLVAGDGSNGFVGDGQKADSWTSIGTPKGVAVDSVGNIYITTKNLVRKIEKSTGIINTVVGYSDGTVKATILVDPWGIFIGPGNDIYIAQAPDNQYPYHSVVKIDTNTWTSTAVAGTGTAGGSPGSSGDGGQATAARLQQPRGVLVDGSGTVYIADTRNHVIREIR